jgi:hypothetical protein
VFFRRNSLDQAMSAVEAAIEAEDADQLEAAHAALCAVPRRVLAARSPELGPRLATLLTSMTPWHGSSFGVLLGALVEWHADAVACSGPVLDRLRSSLADALEFVRLWRDRFGDEDLPRPGDRDDEQVTSRVGAEFADVWLHPYLAWMCLENWELAAVAVLADPRVRHGLADRDELVAMIDQLSPDYGDLSCVRSALLLLHDEPLLVLDRRTGQGFRLRMHDIATNSQLQTLLAAGLIGGGHLRGDAPTREAVGFSTDAPIPMTKIPLPRAVLAFAFTTPTGRWISPDAMPGDIPAVDGVRRLVLDPPPHKQGYVAIRLLPRVPGRLDLEAVLTSEETAAAFPEVQATRPHQAS